MPFRKIFGGDVERVPPDPIPNSEVKPLRADGTARVTWWESRTPPKYSSGHERSWPFFILSVRSCLPPLRGSRSRRRTRGGCARGGGCVHAFAGPRECGGLARRPPWRGLARAVGRRFVAASLGGRDYEALCLGPPVRATPICTKTRRKRDGFNPLVVPGDRVRSGCVRWSVARLMAEPGA